MRLWGTLAKAAALLIIATAMAACGTNREVSVTGGEARAIDPPPYEIRGATTFDQMWIDRTVEAGVQGLGWERPKPRPVEWDAQPAPAKPVVVKPVKKAKPSLWRRLRGKKPAVAHARTVWNG